VKHEIGKHRFARIGASGHAWSTLQTHADRQKVFVFLDAGHDNPASENRRTHVDA
jgi:hypothetical protein